MIFPRIAFENSARRSVKLQGVGDDIRILLPVAMPGFVPGLVVCECALWRYSVLAIPSEVRLPTKVNKSASGLDVLGRQQPRQHLSKLSCGRTGMSGWTGRLDGRQMHIQTNSSTVYILEARSKEFCVHKLIPFRPCRPL